LQLQQAATIKHKTNHERLSQHKMLMRAATVVQVLHGLLYVLLQLLVVAAIILSFIVSFNASFIVVVIPP